MAGFGVLANNEVRVRYSFGNQSKIAAALESDSLKSIYVLYTNSQSPEQHLTCDVILIS